MAQKVMVLLRQNISINFILILIMKIFLKFLGTKELISFCLYGRVLIDKIQSLSKFYIEVKLIESILYWIYHVKFTI